jgi:hypothetical protein
MTQLAAGGPVGPAARNSAVPPGTGLTAAPLASSVDARLLRQQRQ